MYKDTVPTNDENKYIIVLDTEGLGSTDVNKKSDSKLIIYKQDFERVNGLYKSK